MEATTRAEIQHRNAYPDCWSVLDDDRPAVPTVETTPLDSAQARRYVEQMKTRP